MKRLSIEESLRLLAPNSTDPDNEATPVKPKRKARKRVKTPSRSPVRIPKISPVKNYSPSDKIDTIENKSLYEEALQELEEEQIKIDKEEKEIAPHTPTRFTIETPRTPTIKLEQLPKKNIDLELKLRECRYSIIKYLSNEDTNSINYVICFDPNGQIVFISLDKKAKTNIQKQKNVKIIREDNIPTLGSYQNCVLEKLTNDLKGVVFYEKGTYLFATRDDKAEYDFEYYLLEEQTPLTQMEISQSYLVISLTELEQEPEYMMNSSKRNYQIIQQQQLLSNKETFTHLIESMEKLNKQMKSFDKVYKKYADGIVNDWSLLGTFAKDYYLKYSKGVLTEEEKEKFDKVSINMYARFQNFNEHIFMVQDLLPLCGEINKITADLAEKKDLIQDKHATFNNKIIEVEEINNLI